jgi:hypothetical protein
LKQGQLVDLSGVYTGEQQQAATTAATLVGSYFQLFSKTATHQAAV